MIPDWVQCGYCSSLLEWCCVTYWVHTYIHT